MNSPQEEKRLLAAVATGDRRAFTQLYSTYLTGLQRYVFLFTRSEETAQELVQQVFITIWERREQLPEVAHFRSYLYRAAKNLVFDEVRRQQRQVSTYAQVHATRDLHLQPADSALIEQQYQELTQVLINQLPTKRRQIFLLRTQEELTLDEIAEQLAISKSVVKKQLYAAVEFMKKKLVPDGNLVASVGSLWLLVQGLLG